MHFNQIGYWEIFGWKQQSDAVGDFGFGAQYIKNGKEDEARTKELQNGRLAMLAAAELIRHDAYLSAGFYNGEHIITGLPFLYEN